jgi:hypothetical protein
MVWWYCYGGGEIETWLSDGKTDQDWDDLLYQWRVRVGWSGEDERKWWCEFNVSVLVQEGRSVVRIWSGGSEPVLAQWEGSVTWCSSVTTSVGGDAVPRREKGGDDTSWADVKSSLGRQIKKIHAIDSTAINGQ